jgi:hypothetical protein
VYLGLICSHQPSVSFFLSPSISPSPLSSSSSRSPSYAISDSHTLTQTCAHAHTRTRTHARARAHTHTHTHTHTQAHTYTHICTPGAPTWTRSGHMHMHATRNFSHARLSYVFANRYMSSSSTSAVSCMHICPSFPPGLPPLVHHSLAYNKSPQQRASITVSLIEKMAREVE